MLLYYSLFFNDKRQACYPASSWFLLRQTREKSLRATVCFSIEHARARHASRDAFDAKFIFAGSVSVQKNQNVSHPKRKRTIQFSLYFCYHSTKMTVLTEKNAISSRLLCLTTVNSTFYSHGTKKPTKCFKGGVYRIQVESLCV